MRKGHVDDAPFEYHDNFDFYGDSKVGEDDSKVGEPNFGGNIK